MSTTGLEITPELALMAARTLKEFCASEGLACREDCPFQDENKICLYSKGCIPMNWNVVKED